MPCAIEISVWSTNVSHCCSHALGQDLWFVRLGYENLIKAFEKAKRVWDKEGIPRAFIKMMTQLDDFINQVGDWREGELVTTASVRLVLGRSRVA